jgi:hypothetical protein
VAANGNNAYEIGPDGLIIEGGVGIFSGPDDPTASPPTNAPAGSIYHRTTGQSYLLGGSWTEQATSGISAPTHRSLDQLVHLIAETSYLEVTRTAGRVTAVIVWTNSGKTEKVREILITRTNGAVSQILTKQYAAGVITETFTQSVTRSGGKVASIGAVLT